MVRVLVESGRKDDPVGRVVLDRRAGSLKEARGILAERRVEWQRAGFEQDEHNGVVFWRKDVWLQGLVVDERGESLT